MWAGAEEFFEVYLVKRHGKWGLETMSDITKQAIDEFLEEFKNGI